MTTWKFRMEIRKNCNNLRLARPVVGLLLPLLLLLLTVWIDRTHGFSAAPTVEFHRAIQAKKTRKTNKGQLWLLSPDSDADATTTTTTTAAATEKNQKDLSFLDKINAFLDTPILDANNRNDQGAVAEVLKDFVRDEPEIAQVAFSAAVVGIMVLLTRLVMSFS